MNRMRRRKDFTLYLSFPDVGSLSIRQFNVGYLVQHGLKRIQSVQWQRQDRQISMTYLDSGLVIIS